MNFYSPLHSSYNTNSTRITNHKSASTAYSSVHNSNSRLSSRNISNLLTSTSGSENMKKIFAATSTDLKATNNVIDIKNGVNYKVKTLLHGNIGTNIKNGLATTLWDENSNDVSAVNDNVATNKFINCLSQIGSGKANSDVINSNFTNSNEVLARFQSLGITPGKFEIKGSKKELFLDTNGWVSNYEDVVKARENYNSKDFSKLGFTENSKFIIDGKEYHIDKTGHLNIPEGVICTPARTKIVK